VRRRQLLAACMLLASAFPWAGVAQGKLARIGILRSGRPPDPFTSAFVEEMRALGYIEGHTVVYEIRWAEGDPERGPALARELAGQKVDLILTGGDNLIRAAPKRRQGRRLSWAPATTRSGQGWPRAWRGPAETSPG
jgi:putative ABC transport system substrate-binding protein